MEPSDASRTVEPQTLGPSQIFFAFSRLALSGFGGVLPFAYRALVEQHRWLSPREFAGLLAMAQVMPGPTICNLSVMVGQRYAGFAGACAALAGMVAAPSLIVIALGIAWQRYGDMPSVKRALVGMSAVAIGLILATAVKMAINIFKREASDDATSASYPQSQRLSHPQSQRPSYWTMRNIARIMLCVLAFAGVGLMRWPLVVVIASLAPFAIALSWFSDR